MILTSRQLAIVVWLVIFVAWALTVKGVRSSVRSMLATLFSPKLLALFAIIIGYNVAVVWGLWRGGYWDATMVYATVVFVAVGGIGSVSRAASRGATYDRRFFFRTILVNLEVMVVFAFLSDFFPFRFWVDFLLVIPLVTLLVMSAFFVPVMFFACALFAYEDAFLVVSFKSEDDKRLTRWKKRRLFLRFILKQHPCRSGGLI